MAKKTVLIKNLPFEYDTDTHYEKDGHVFCKTCAEQIDGVHIFAPGIYNFISYQRCECDRKRIKEEQEEERLKKIELLKDRCFKGFDNVRDVYFSNTDPKTSAYKMVKNYLKNFSEMYKDNIGLLFSGGVGVGKTYLAACLANHLIKVYSLRVNFTSLHALISEIESQDLDIDKSYYIEKLTSVPYLIIDDFGVERTTDYTLELIYQIINARYNAALPFLISINIPVVEIKEEKNIKLQRIYSRILERCLPVEFETINLREKLNKERMAKALAVLLGIKEEK